MASNITSNQKGNTDNYLVWYKMSKFHKIATFTVTNSFGQKLACNTDFYETLLPKMVFLPVKFAPCYFYYFCLTCLVNLDLQQIMFHLIKLHKNKISGSALIKSIYLLMKKQTNWRKSQNQLEELGFYMITWYMIIICDYLRSILANQWWLA